MLIKYENFIKLLENEMVDDKDLPILFMSLMMNYEMKKTNNGRYFYYGNKDNKLHIVITDFDLKNGKDEYGDIIDEIKNNKKHIFTNQVIEELDYKDFIKFQRSPEKLTKKKSKEIIDILDKLDLEL